MSMSEEAAGFSLRVYPHARKSEVVGYSGEILWVRVSAPPVRGEANKELIAYLSRLLGVGRDSVRIVKGHTSRNKVVAISGLSREEVLGRILPSE